MIGNTNMKQHKNNLFLSIYVFTSNFKQKGFPSQVQFCTTKKKNSTDFKLEKQYLHIGDLLAGWGWPEKFMLLSTKDEIGTNQQKVYFSVRILSNSKAIIIQEIQKAQLGHFDWQFNC